jgi:hypothetical protein
MKNFDNFKKEQQIGGGDFTYPGGPETEEDYLNRVGENRAAGWPSVTMPYWAEGVPGSNQMGGLLKFLQGFNVNQPMPGQGPGQFNQPPPAYAGQGPGQFYQPPPMPDRKLNIPRIEDNMYEGGVGGPTGGSEYFNMGGNYEPPEGY